MTRTIFLLLSAAFLAAGCSMGPTMLKGSRLGYNQHLHASNNEELLVNIVRLHYGEQPLFLQVGSISANFGQAANVGMASTFQTGGGMHPVTSHTPSLGYQYSESPTIIYTPVQGTEFATRLLSEIELSTFLLLARGGSSVRTLSRLMVMRIGQLDNPIPGGPKSCGPENNDAMFVELINIFKNQEQRGDLEFVRMETKDGVDRAVVRMRFADHDEATRMEKLMGTKIPVTPLASGDLTATVTLSPVNDFTSQESGTVYFKLRNLLQVFWALSFGVDEAGKSRPPGKTFTSYTDSDEGKLPRLLVAIKTSAMEPQNAYTRVFTRGKWYYIDDDDLYSKFCLGLLGSLYSLQANPPAGGQPLLTLPISR